MTLDELLTALFPAGRQIQEAGGLISGTGDMAEGAIAHVVGITGGVSPGVDEAVALAGWVLDIAAQDDGAPLLVIIDSGSQRMSRRDELLGLSEALAHLAKTLRLAEESGHRTIGLLYGGTAAGAFIATALASGTLVALPDAHPEVMDLASMARVTKLSVETLKQKAQDTPIFAPGLDNLFVTGAIASTWDPARSLNEQLLALLDEQPDCDTRATMGKRRGGRKKACDIAAEVRRLAEAHG